jgi:hypothetical protein
MNKVKVFRKRCQNWEVEERIIFITMCYKIWTRCDYTYTTYLDGIFVYDGDFYG